MSDKIMLDHDEFQNLKNLTRAARAEYLRRHATPALGAIASRLRTHYVIAIVAILLISFGVKMFFLSAPTAGANTLAAPTSMNVLQHSDHLHKNNLPRSS